MNYWFNDRYNGNLSGKYPLRIPFTISTIDFKTSSLFIVDGLLYSVSDNELCIYDENGLEKKESIGEGVSRIVTATEDVLVVKKEDGSCVVVNLENGDEIGVDSELPKLAVKISKLDEFVVAILSSGDPLVGGDLVCFNVANFEKKWSYTLYRGPLDYSLDEEKLILVEQLTKAISFIDVKNGELIKQIKIDELNLDHLKRSESDKLRPNLKPFVYQGCLVVRLERGQLICLDANTGELRWAMDPKLSRPEICVSNAGILIAVSGSDLVRIDVVKGEELSRIPITREDGSLLNSIDPVDVKVLSTTHAWCEILNVANPPLLAINLETAQIEWGTNLEFNTIGDLVICNNRLYVDTFCSGLMEREKPARYVIEGAGGYIPD